MASEWQSLGLNQGHLPLQGQRALFLLPCPPNLVPGGRGRGRRKPVRSRSTLSPPNRKTRLQARRPEGRWGRKLSGSVSTTRATLPGDCEQEAGAEMGSSCQCGQQAGPCPQELRGPHPMLQRALCLQEGCLQVERWGRESSNRGRNMWSLEQNSQTFVTDKCLWPSA